MNSRDALVTKLSSPYIRGNFTPLSFGISFAESRLKNPRGSGPFGLQGALKNLSTVQ
jgi:hypothetical protein